MDHCIKSVPRRDATTRTNMMQIRAAEQIIGI